MIDFDIPFIFLHISALVLLTLILFILKLEHKSNLKYLLVVEIFLFFILPTTQIIDIYLQAITGKSSELLIMIYFTGIIFIPLCLLFIGLIYANKKLSFNWKYTIPFITQSITFLVMITNKYHNLFFIKYSSNNIKSIYGNYFFIHTIFSYLYILIGLYYLLHFSIRNSGIFSKQSILIFSSFFLPFIVNVLMTLKIFSMSTYINEICFTFTGICLFIAITKFKFLKSIPLGMELIYNIMEDSILILDIENKLIECNKKFKNKFIHFIKNNELSKKNDTEFLIIDKIIKNIKTAHTNNKFMKFEFHYEINDEYYLIEIIPFNNKKFRIIDQNGTVIIFKDITEVKKLNIKLVEQDRLVNLGILSGGIAHDISNPASVIESCLYYLKYNFKKLENENNPQKKNILQSKISKSLDTSYSACNKILFMVKSIKNQTRNLSSGDIREFSINSLLKDVLLILDHQLKKTYCTYELIESDPKIKITGDYTKLSQVITNLIINSVEAYENKPGLVKIILKKSSDNAIIIVEDKAGGIKNKKHETIFKDIISTKKNGTGLGLYISHRLITSDFDGKMSFETQLDIGTTFTISIPMFKR